MALMSTKAAFEKRLRPTTAGCSRISFAAEDKKRLAPDGANAGPSCSCWTLRATGRSFSVITQARTAGRKLAMTGKTGAEAPINPTTERPTRKPALEATLNKAKAD